MSVPVKWEHGRSCSRWFRFIRLFRILLKGIFPYAPNAANIPHILGVVYILWCFNFPQIMTTSSNSSVVEEFFKKLYISWMNTKHSSGPRTLELGTPEVTSDVCYCCCYVVYGLVGYCLLEKMRFNWYHGMPVYKSVAGVGLCQRHWRNATEWHQFDHFCQGLA